jgi:hypothetical protein
MPPLTNPVHEKFAQAIAQGHCSQADAWLAAIGPERAAKVFAKHKRPTALTSAASKLAAKSSIRARIAEIKEENAAECRWNRRQLMDFYVDCLEQPAGTLRADDRLCQSIERITTEHFNSKGELVRTVTRERLSLPSKTECGEAIRAMCGWDKRGGDLPEDDITELLVMIRKRSSNAAPGTAKPAEVNSGGHSQFGVAKSGDLDTFPESTAQVLEPLSKGHPEPLPIQLIPFGPE